MKFKHFLIVSLILTILTVGAVSASNDLTSTDNLTADVNDDLGDVVLADDDIIGEDENNADDEVLGVPDEGLDTLGYSGVNPLDGDVNYPDDDALVFTAFGRDTGTLKIFVDSDLRFTKEITDSDYSPFNYLSFGISLNQLDIKEEGTYWIYSTFNDTEIGNNYLTVTNDPVIYKSTCYIDKGNLYYPQRNLITFSGYDPEIVVGNLTIYVNENIYITEIKSEDYNEDPYFGPVCSKTFNLEDLGIDETGYYYIKVYFHDLNNKDSFIKSQSVEINNCKYEDFEINTRTGNLKYPDNEVINFHSWCEYDEVQISPSVVGNLTIYISDDDEPGYTTYYTTIIEEDYVYGGDGLCHYRLSIPLKDLRINKVGWHNIKVVLEDTTLEETEIYVIDNPYPGVYVYVSDGNIQFPEESVVYFESHNKEATGVFKVYINGTLVYTTTITEENYTYDYEYYLSFDLNLNDLKINKAGEYDISVTLNDYELLNDELIVIDNPYTSVSVYVDEGNIQFPEEPVVFFYSPDSTVVGEFKVYIDGTLVYNTTIAAEDYDDGYNFGINLNDLKITTNGKYSISATLNDYKLLDDELIVINDKYPDVYVDVSAEGNIQFPEESVVSFSSEDLSAVGVFEVYTDGTLVYTTTITEENYTYDEDLGEYHFSFELCLNDLKITAPGEYTISAALNDYRLLNDKIKVIDIPFDVDVRVYTGNIQFPEGPIVYFYSGDSTATGDFEVYIDGTLVYTTTITEENYTYDDYCEFDLYLKDLKIESSGLYNISATLAGYEVLNGKLHVSDHPYSECYVNSYDGDIQFPEEYIVNFYSEDLSAVGEFKVYIDGKVVYATNITKADYSPDEEGYYCDFGLDLNDLKITTTGYYNITATLNEYILEENIIHISESVPMDIIVPENAKTPEFTIKLPSDATGKLNVTVNGKTYTADLVNGSATITVPDLADGTYDVTISYSGNAKYPAVTKKTNVTIKTAKDPVYNIINNKDITMLYTAKTPYKVLVTKDGKAVGAGEEVIITFNGNNYKVKTDKNGYATLKLPNVKPKKAKYTITATYKGVTVTNKVKVNSIIKAANKKVKKSKKVTKVKVSLKKVNGKYLKAKKLKIKFNKKTYKVKTNKKGVATWKVKKSMLKKLKVGKKYKYTVTYGKDKVTKKLTIKK